MFRIIKASRSAQLRSYPNLARSLSCTPIPKLAGKVSPGEFATETISIDEPESAPLSPLEAPIARKSRSQKKDEDIPYGATVEPKLRAPRTRKKPEGETSENGTIEPKPRARRTRKKPEVGTNEDATEKVVPTIRRRRKPTEKVTSGGVDSSGTTPGPKKRKSIAKVPKVPKLQDAKSTDGNAVDGARIDGRTLRTFGQIARERPDNPRENVKEYLEWGYGGTWKGAKVLGDKKRMNIISEAACDDVLDRLKPSLEKLIGCDIIDINPGAAIWSSKIHNFLKPRTHILMEPDTKMYSPLLDPLLNAPGSTYKLVPKSGIVWAHLEKTLSEEFLPFQEARHREDPRSEMRNDTLLVVANLGFHPKRPYRGFNSLAQMVMYQFLSAIKAHSLFQKYGLVRMLIWINDEEKNQVIPRCIQLRRKASTEAGISCEKIEEIASSTDDLSIRFNRERHLDFESARRVLKRMEENGVKVPPGRESILLKDLARSGDERPIAGFSPEFLAELKAAEALEASGEMQKMEDADLRFKRMKNLRWTHTSVVSQRRHVQEMCDEYEAIWAELRKCSATEELGNPKLQVPAELDGRMAKWQDAYDVLSIDNQNQVRGGCENRLALSHDPPMLLWDRREAEPLRLHRHEFYPQKEMCLLDIHPQSIWPILRKKFPENYDIFEYILSTFFSTPSQSVEHGLRSLEPGAYEWFTQECKTLTDPSKGGNPDLDMLTVRMLTDEMLEEIMEAWERWPWKPSRYETLAKMGSTVHDPMDVEEQP